MGKKEGMEIEDDEEEEDMVLEFGPGMNEPKLPKKSKYNIRTERDIELEFGDDYVLDLQKNFDLPEEQRYDVIPETWQGHNIADYVDPDIMEKLEALEKEEEARERAGYYDSEESEEDESYAEIKELAGKIRHKKAIMKADQFLDNTKKPTLDRKSVAKKRERSVSRLQSEFEELGVTGLEVDNPESHFNKARSTSRARPIKKMRVGEDASQGAKLDKLKKKADKKTFNRMGKAGESDRRIQEKKPKHLFTGKRGIGKTDRR